MFLIFILLCCIFYHCTFIISLHNNINKDIIGIAVSGQSDDTLDVCYFLKLKDEKHPKQIQADNALLLIENIQKAYKAAKHIEITSEENLVKTLRSLNVQFHNENIVRDTERSLFFSGLMIALKDSTFRSTYRQMQKPSIEEAEQGNLCEAHLLNEAIVTAITRQLETKVNNLSKEYNWRDKFAFIKTIDYPLARYKEMIATIENKIFLPFENEEKYDVLGKAYKIFLSRAGKVDNKNIILTPDHIKSLMVKLARLSIDDVVLDTCTGSGGFLMESMETMIKAANGNEQKIRQIKEEQLIGFETDPVLFALACSNMFLHGDGRTNLIYRSSLLHDNADNIVGGSDNEIMAYIKELKPTKVIINPPYENNKPIRFVKQALDYLLPNGKLIIIMPTPTLTRGQDGKTQKILEKAKLDFVIKMPENLFSEQNRIVNTSVFGFTKTPHKCSDDVMFYNLEDDGLVSIQHKGRVDKYNLWATKEQAVIDSIFNSIEVKGVAEKRKIYKDDVLNCTGIKGERTSKYELMKISDLFNLEKGTLASEDCNETGQYDFITAASEWKKHDCYDRECEAIVFATDASGSLARTHYVNGKFIASNLCVVLTSKNDKEHPVSLKFYDYYFKTIRKQLRSDLADGTSKLTIKMEDLYNYYIEYIPLTKQNCFVHDNIEPLEQLYSQVKYAEQNVSYKLGDLIK